MGFGVGQEAKGRKLVHVQGRIRGTMLSQIVTDRMTDGPIDRFHSQLSEIRGDDDISSRNLRTLLVTSCDLIYIIFI